MQTNIPVAFLSACLLVANSILPASSEPRPPQPGYFPSHLVVGDTATKLPPLSGITLSPNKKSGTFTLIFGHPLEEPATIRVINGAKKVLYSNNIVPDTARVESRYDVGKLPNGFYLVEVRTSNTTYWKKLRVRR